MDAYVFHRAWLPVANTQLASKARRAGLMTSYRMSPTERKWHEIQRSVHHIAQNFTNRRNDLDK